jgi:hypothetical protein
MKHWSTPRPAREAVLIPACLLALLFCSCSLMDDQPFLSMIVMNSTLKTTNVGEKELAVGAEAPVRVFAASLNHHEECRVTRDGYDLGTLRFVCTSDASCRSDVVAVNYTLTEPSAGLLAVSGDGRGWSTASFSPANVQVLNLVVTNNSSATTCFEGYTPVDAGATVNLCSMGPDGSLELRVWRDSSGNQHTLGGLSIDAAEILIPRVDSSTVTTELSFIEPTPGHLQFVVSQPYPYVELDYSDSLK